MCKNAKELGRYGSSHVETFDRSTSRSPRRLQRSQSISQSTTLQVILAHYLQALTLRPLMTDGRYTRYGKRTSLFAFLFLFFHMRKQTHEFLFSISENTILWSIQLDAEFNRQGLLFGGKWKMAAQNSYDICSSYPLQFGIPSQFNTGKLGVLAKGRHDARIPILSW